MHEGTPMMPPMGYQPPLQSVSKSTKPHKFFERYLDNDLDKLKADLLLRYEMIESGEYQNVTKPNPFEPWASSKSVSTMKWREYNALQFHTPEIYNLYRGIRSTVKEACEYYEIDYDAQQFMIQSWFNINYAKLGKLDWHDHGPDGAPNFHGYYCVSAEPSETHYIAFDEQKINHNVNNKLVISEMGHPHAMGNWDWDGPRITIAYDITPLADLAANGKLGAEQHWIPLD